jgi:hypothetical protein
MATQPDQAVLTLYYFVMTLIETTSSRHNGVQASSDVVRR